MLDVVFSPQDNAATESGRPRGSAQLFAGLPIAMTSEYRQQHGRKTSGRFITYDSYRSQSKKTNVAPGRGPERRGAARRARILGRNVLTEFETLVA
jgi:hypothetical protein